VPILAEIAQLPPVASLVFQIERDTGIKRLRVNMQADTPRRPRVLYLVNRL
jgi:hypothetical protein